MKIFREVLGYKMIVDSITGMVIFDAVDDMAKKINRFKYVFSLKNISDEAITFDYIISYDWNNNIIDYVENVSINPGEVKTIELFYDPRYDGTTYLGLNNRIVAKIGDEEADITFFKNHITNSTLLTNANDIKNFIETNYDLSYVSVGIEDYQTIFGEAQACVLTDTNDYTTTYIKLKDPSVDFTPKMGLFFFDIHRNGYYGWVNLKYQDKLIYHFGNVDTQKVAFYGDKIEMYSTEDNKLKLYIHGILQ